MGLPLEKQPYAPEFNPNAEFERSELPLMDADLQQQYAAGMDIEIVLGLYRMNEGRKEAEAHAKFVASISKDPPQVVSAPGAPPGWPNRKTFTCCACRGALGSYGQQKQKT